MAKLLPAVRDFSAIYPKGERLVARRLQEELPDDVLVFHSYLWLQEQPHPGTKKDYLRPGEIDFIVVDPATGILVLEVKDSHIRYDQHKATWEQQNRKTKKWTPIEPFAQARKNMYALQQHLREHGGWDASSKFTLANAVVFPDSEFVGPLPAAASESTLLDASKVKQLGKSVRKAMDAYCAVWKAKGLSPQLLQKIRAALNPAYELVPVTWRQVENQEEELHRLTRDQMDVLRLLQNQTRMAIQGVAGSGKTMLAVAQAQRLAKEGKRVLLMCFNELLAESIRLSMPIEYDNRVAVSTFHGICNHFCTQADIKFAPPEDPQEQAEFWQTDVVELLEKAGMLLDDSEKFDALIIDEGQDFDPFWYVGFPSLYKSHINPDKGPLTVFFDDKQALFRDETLLPNNLTQPFVLPTNCRNTRLIAEHCGDVLDFDAQVHEFAPEGKEPELVEGIDPAQVVGYTRKVIARWTNPKNGGLRAEQIAILLPRKGEVEWPQKLGNIPLVENLDEWRAGKGVLLATNRRFKGLEADALVLAGVPTPGSRRFYTEADHYVACSRAKHLLVILQVEKKAAGGPAT